MDHEQGEQTAEAGTAAEQSDGSVGEEKPKDITKLVLAGGVIVLVLVVLVAVLMGKRGGMGVPKMALPTAVPTATPEPAKAIPTVGSLKELKETEEVGTGGAVDVNLRFVSSSGNSIVLQKGEETIAAEVPENISVQRQLPYTDPDTNQETVRYQDISLSEIKAGEAIQTVLIPLGNGQFKTGPVVVLLEKK